MPKIDITSTAVRELIRKNKDISEFVPEVVKEYIHENKLYKNNPED
jgi:nicotinic acid mononucleotide adenylyltransferase